MILIQKMNFQLKIKLNRFKTIYNIKSGDSTKKIIKNYKNMKTTKVLK